MNFRQMSGAQALQCLSLALLLGALGCSVSPSTSAVQAGDSFVVPLQIEAFGAFDSGITKVGYGSASYVDSQRGSLVVVAHHQDIANYSIEFVTQVAAPIEAPARGNSLGLGGVALLVDVPEMDPANIPIETGEYELEILHRSPDGLVDSSVGLTYDRRIHILPPSLSYPGLVGGPLESEHSRNWFYGFNSTFGSWMSDFTNPNDPDFSAYNTTWQAVVQSNAIPAPALRIGAKRSYAGQSVVELPYAVELDVTYPHPDVSLLSARAVNPNLHTYWLDDDENGNATVKGVATSTVHLSEVWLNFNLNASASAPVTPNDFTIVVREVHDLVGVAQDVDFYDEIVDQAIR